jgi:protein-S-isoprenylcysteine O-methyltransferase Ste14
MDNETITDPIDYNNRNATDGLVVATPITDMFNIVFYLVLAGVILGGITVLVGFLTSFRFVPGWATMLLGIMAAGLIVAGPAYLLYASPRAWQDGNEEQEVVPLGSSGPFTDFWGEQTSDVEDDTWYYTAWGPGWAWYTTLIIGTLMMIFSFTFLGLKHGAEEPDYYRRRRGYDDYDRRRDRDYDRRIMTEDVTGIMTEDVIGATATMIETVEVATIGSVIKDAAAVATMTTGTMISISRNPGMGS